MRRYSKPWLVTSLVFVAICADGQSGKDADSVGHAACPHGTRILLTGRPDGYYYKVGKAIADVAQEQCKNAPTSPCLRICAKESEQTLDNIQELAERDDDVAFAIVQGDVAHDAWYGQPLPLENKGKPVSFAEVRLVTPLYAEAVHILLRPHLNITTLAGLRGKRVWLGPDGSSTEYTARRVLSSVGLDPHPSRCESLDHPVSESDAQVVTCIKGIKDFSKAMPWLKEGGLDALFKIGPVPSSDIASVILPASAAPDGRSEFQILPFDYDLAHQYAQDGSYVERLIQKDAYGQRDATLSIGVPALLLTNLDKQDEDVAWLANLVREHRRDIEKKMDVKLGLLDIKTKEASFVVHDMAAPSFYQRWKDWTTPGIMATIALIGIALGWRRVGPKFGQLLVAVLRHRLSLASAVLGACYCLGALWLEHLESGVNEAFRSFPMSVLSTIRQSVPLLQSQMITPEGQSQGRIVISLISLAAAFFLKQWLWPSLKQLAAEVRRRFDLPAAAAPQSDVIGQQAVGHGQPSLAFRRKL